jgi:hypothetical protein
MAMGHDDMLFPEFITFCSPDPVIERGKRGKSLW